jgi:hypothetical protein
MLSSSSCEEEMHDMRGFEEEVINMTLQDSFENKYDLG